MSKVMLNKEIWGSLGSTRLLLTLGVMPNMSPQRELAFGWNIGCRVFEVNTNQAHSFRLYDFIQLKAKLSTSIPLWLWIQALWKV